MQRTEYMTAKYDDLTGVEREILHQMEINIDAKRTWKNNDFRNIKAMRNDGKRIADVLSSLSQKGYIRKNDRGLWKLERN